MANVNITKNRTNGIRIWEPVHADELVTFDGAGTLKAGTILARDTGTGELVPFVKGGATTGNGDAKAVLGYELTAGSAESLSARPIIGGRIRAADLVIDADGDASNVDGAVLDELRDYGIVAMDTAQLSNFDNE